MEEETGARIDQSQTMGYIPHGQHKALSPAHWVNLSFSPREMMAKERVLALSWS
jgi:hypothetical protein